jgi:D-3-phosphoglycerate dehydrogenase
MLNILVAESKQFSKEAKLLLMQMGDLRLEDIPTGALANELEETDVLWVRLRSRIDASVLNRAPRLKVIASPTTGLTHIDMAAAAERNIRVVSLQGEVQFLRTIHATAEYTIGLMLSLLRHIPSAVEHVRQRGWNRDLFRGNELFERSVGIVGYGRLGKIVAKYLNAFECDVLVADPKLQMSEVRPPVRVTSFEELLTVADIVTVHVDLNASTHRLFGREQFQRMKPGALLINTSRGEVLDEVELIRALKTGILGGAALDVITEEHQYSVSPVAHYARTNPNLIVTPHVGGCTEESMRRTEVFLAHRLGEVLSAMTEPTLRSRAIA